MKTILSSIVVCAAIAVEAAVTTNALVNVEELTPEQRQARKEKFKEILNRRTGGFVRKAGSGKGLVAIVNVQNRVSAKDLQKPVDYITKRLHLPVEVRAGKLTGMPSRKSVKDAGANLAVFVVDDASVPNTIILAPEDGWAVVNVAALAEGNPAAAMLALRVRKEVSRAFGYLAGCADSQYAGSVMGPISNMSDLDGIMGDVVPADAFARIHRHLAKRGVEPYIEGTYRAACEAGWAPAPTNEYQKAIWDKVHTLPTNPIKIKYDPKKGE